MNGQQIRARFNAQWAARKVVEYSWNLVNRFVMPLRTGDFFLEYYNEYSVQWERHRREVYDSTAVSAAENLAASVHSGLTSALVRWFSIRFRQAKLNEIQESKIWLEDCADIAWEAMRESNFDLEIGETYTDLVGFGTSPFSEEQTERNGSFDSLDFKSMPIRESYFEMDHRNQALIFYRWLRWLPLQIVEKFGRENVPEHIQAKADNPDASTERVELIYCVYQREDKKNADISQTLPPKERPFGEKYVLRNDGEELGEEGGYYEMPVAMARWRTANTSQWGYSPPMVVMGDILTLNDIVSMESDAFEKNIDPTLFTTQRGLLSKRDLEAGGITVMRNLAEMKFLERNVDVAWTRWRVERMQQMIRQAFLVDQLELKESPAMTATEVNVRYELMQRLLGPTFGRLKSDLLDKIVRRTFNILYRAGQFPLTPQVVRDMQGQLDIEYTGPMARAQKAERVGAIERYATNVTSLAAGVSQMDPKKGLEILDNIDGDKLSKELADLLGVPADLLPSQGDIDKKREQRNQVEEQARQLQAAQATGDAGESLGKAAQQLQVVQGGGQP